MSTGNKTRPQAVSVENRVDSGSCSPEVAGRSLTVRTVSGLLTRTRVHTPHTHFLALHRRTENPFRVLRLHGSFRGLSPEALVLVQIQRRFPQHQLHAGPGVFRAVMSPGASLHITV